MSSPPHRAPVTVYSVCKRKPHVGLGGFVMTLTSRPLSGLTRTTRGVILLLPKPSVCASLRSGNEWIMHGLH